MTAPKHLWSGDWESESAAAAARRRQLDRLGAPQSPPSAPTPPPAPARGAPDRTGPVERALTALRAIRRPRRRPRTARPRRAAILITIALLVIAGGAYAVSSLADSGSPGSAGRTPWLGVQMLSVPGGALISEVVPRSPAARAGLRAGDVITQIQSRPVVSPVNVTNAIEVLTPGQTVQLQFQRGPRTYTANVTLATRPSHFSSS